MTILGPKVTAATAGNSLFLAGAQLRRNCEESIYNSLILGWSDGTLNGLLIDASKGIPTDNNLSPNGGLNFQNNIITGTTANAVKYAPSSTAATGATTASITAWVNTPAYANTMLANNTDAGLTAPFNYTAPDFNPGSATVPAATGATFTNAKLISSFFTPVSYKGACAVGDTWWKNWTKYM